METLSKWVSVICNIIVAAVAIAGAVFVNDVRKEVKFIFVEQKGIIERLRDRFDLFEKRRAAEHEGFLKRLDILERRKIGDTPE